MFIQAKTTIKIALGKYLHEESAPIEVDDETGAELVKLGAALEVLSPAEVLLPAEVPPQREKTEK